MKFRFHKKYAFLFILSVLLEIAVLIGINDPMAKSSFGGILLVAILYCLIQSVLEIDRFVLVLIVGALALFAEFSKLNDGIKSHYFHENQVLGKLLGPEFEINQIWSFLIGCSLIYFLEVSNDNSRPTQKKFLNF